MLRHLELPHYIFILLQQTILVTKTVSDRRSHFVTDSHLFVACYNYFFFRRVLCCSCIAVLLNTLHYSNHLQISLQSSLSFPWYWFLLRVSIALLWISSVMLFCLCIIKVRWEGTSENANILEFSRDISVIFIVSDISLISVRSLRMVFNKFQDWQPVQTVLNLSWEVTHCVTLWTTGCSLSLDCIFHIRRRWSSFPNLGYLQSFFSIGKLTFKGCLRSWWSNYFWLPIKCFCILIQSAFL